MMDFLAMATRNARTQFASTIPAPLREIDEAMRTHYAVQRTSDGAYWVFGDHWTYSLNGAARFSTMTMAQLVGEADCPADPLTWEVTPVEGA